MRIATLSSQSVSSSLNKDMVSHGYQGEYAEELNELDLEYNEFFLRLYDPQIGKFIQADPFDQFPSPYIGMGDDPVNMNDPSGGFAGMGVGASIAAGAVGGFIVGGAAALVTGHGDQAFAWALGGAVAGALIGLGSEINWDGSGNALKGVATMGAARQAMNVTIQMAEQFGNNVVSVSSNPAADGVRDAIINALLLGAPDVYDGFMNNNPLDNYSSESDKQAYMLSRAATDGAIAAIALKVSSGANAASGAAQIAAIAGSGTVVVGIGGEVVAVATKALAYYGASVAAAATTDIVFMAKFNNHHNDPKWAGGDPKQKYQTKMLEEQHQALHKAMNDFLKAINKKLVPTRGNNRFQIRDAFGRKFILEKLAEFYRSKPVQENFKEAADNFFKLHPGL